MRRRRMQTRVAGWVLALSLAYGAFAYLVAPEFWSWLDRGNTTLPDKMVTTTPQGIPGDPINVGLVGSKPELLHAFATAGWSAADAITWRSSLEIGESVLFDRPYSDAPVSTLVFDGRRQDLAFEKPVGKSADRRHHVRLWQMADNAPDGRPFWLGSASYDRLASAAGRERVSRQAI